MDAIQQNLEKCISSLGEKILKWPYNFFTESDAHSFLYYYIFRYGSKEIKGFYPTKDNHKTVLVHREYPTSFRFRKDDMKIYDDGGRGHYDLVVLNPNFIFNHNIKDVMAKEYKHCMTDCKDHILSALEFKLITKPLDKNMKDEIKKDIIKLKMAIEQGQTQKAYCLIFNRCREESDFVQELCKWGEQNSEVKILYIETVLKEKRHYLVKYINGWDYKNKYENGNCV
mgnify:FL=1